MLGSGERCVKRIHPTCEGYTLYPGGGGMERRSDAADSNKRKGTQKVDVRLPGKENSNSRGARPVHLIITMIKWNRTSRLSIKKSLSRQPRPLLDLTRTSLLLFLLGGSACGSLTRRRSNANTHPPGDNPGANG